MAGRRKRAKRDQIGEQSLGGTLLQGWRKPAAHLLHAYSLALHLQELNHHVVSAIVQYNWHVAWRQVQAKN